MADTWVFVQNIANAIINNNVKRSAIFSNDTDIVVIAAATFDKLYERGLKELWVAFESEKRTWLHNHALVEILK